MPWCALAFLSGIVFVETRAELEAVVAACPMIAALAAAVFAAAVFARAASRVVLALHVLGFLALGVLWVAWRAGLQLDQRLDPSLEGVTLVIVGDVASIPVHGAQRVQFDLESARGAGASRGDTSARRLPSRVRLTWYDAPRRPRAGERWRLEVKLRQPRAFANPGGFDYEGQLLRESIGATGYVRTSDHNALVAAAGWRRPVLRAREAIALRMQSILATSPAAGVLVGLAVGETPGITPAQWRVFSATGTTHLIAISGFHVTMVGALGMLAASLFWRLLPGPPRIARTDLASLCGLAAAAAYSVLAGLSVPTQRTLVMLIAACLASYLRRAQPAADVLSLALLAVLFLDPHAALSPGFWLSFCAVAAIFMALDGARSRRGWLHEFLRMQAAVTVALAPITLALFGSVSLVAPLANLVAIPLFSLLLVPLTLASLVLFAASAPLGEALLRLCAALFEATWPLFQWLAGLPWALVYLSPPQPWLIGGLVVASVIAILPLPWRLRLLGLAFLLPLAFPRSNAPRAGDFDLHVLDVGQGLAVVVRTHRHTLLYDAGPAFRGGASAGDLAVMPFLRHGGVRRIDMLVLSHADRDHTGGAPAILAALPVTATRHGARVASGGGDTRPCAHGEAWVWDGVRFEFLHPPGDRRQRDHAEGGGSPRPSDNDSSCVMRIATATRSLLLLGDIEARVERRLLAGGLPLDADVLVVPHHGSRSSSTAALVNAASVRLAIVSAGHGNRWRFPHEEVVARWCASGAAVAETAEWGAVTLRLSADGAISAPAMEPRAWRAVHRRYWHAPAARAGASRCPGRAAVPAPRALRYHPARS